MAADINEIERSYEKLKIQYENGSLIYDDYITAVDALRVQDENGIYWQIRADDGKWVRWDGNTWVPGERPGHLPQGDAGYREEAGPPVQGSRPPATARPGTGITGFLKLFIKSAALGFAKNIPWMILIAIIVWLLHLFLVWIANPSATPGSISGLASILVIPGNEVAGAIFWLLLSWLISTLIFQLRFKRFGKSLRNIGKIPDWIGESFHDSLLVSMLLVTTGFVLALLIASLIQNVIISIQLVMVSLGWMAAQKEGVLVVFTGVIWGSVSRAFASGKKSTFHASFAGSAILGMSLGFILSLVAPLKGMAGILFLCCAGLVIVTIVVARGVRP